MSRTRRKSSLDTQKNWGEYAPTQQELHRSHMDKKPGNKPTKGFKRAQRKKDSRKPEHVLKRAIAQNKDLDNIVLPDAKKHDQWDYT